MSKIWDWLFGLGEEAWCIGYREIAGGEESLLKDRERRFDLLLPSMRYWYADPIPYFYYNKEYIFMEVYDRIKRIGRIGVAEFDSRGRLLRPSIIIEEKFHLSFPLVFEEKGQVYLIPESHSVNQIRIYKMKDSVQKWELWHSFETEKQLSDSVVYRIEKKLFLICTDKLQDNPYKNKLWIYRIEDLNDRSKVKLVETSCNTADYSYSIRNGGKIFHYRSDAYRVIQEAEYKNYGKNLAFRRIIKCDESRFQETDDLLKISHEDLHYEINNMHYRVNGIHTYGFAERRGWEVIDLKLQALSAVQFARVIFCSLRRCINLPIKYIKELKDNKKGHSVN